MNVTIPRLQGEHAHDRIPNSPGWIRTVAYNDEKKVMKPIIRCNCGELIALHHDHHIHPDGRVTASFYDLRQLVAHEKPEGCGWHVYLTLEDWTGEDLPPTKEA